MNETEKRDRRDEKEEIRYHVIFYGQVQGVGFRYRAYYAAYQLGLTGWVRNCWDETVEMEVQGDEETITEMIKRIRTSSYIEITDAKWTKIPLESEFGFRCRSGRCGPMGSQNPRRGRKSRRISQDPEERVR